jgi:release factor glutamine methyltransferase
MRAAQSTNARLVRRGEALLSEHGVPNARRNAEWLLAHVLGCRSTDLYFKDDVTAGPEAVERYQALLSRRAAREPLQYIIGSTEFMSLPFECEPGVFIPRPETELLVEITESAVRRAFGGSAVRLLDLCCGTGAVGISLLCRLPEATAVAVDVSEPAVRLSERNARLNHVAARFRSERDDARTYLSSTENVFEAIACNPPYIALDEMPLLPPDVRLHEPSASLEGGSDGLDFYRSVVPVLERCLAPEGIVTFEIGATQGAAVTALLRNASFLDVSVRKDFAGHDRVVAAKRR